MHGCSSIDSHSIHLCARVGATAVEQCLACGTGGAWWGASLYALVYSTIIFRMYEWGDLKRFEKCLLRLLNVHVC